MTLYLTGDLTICEVRSSVTLYLSRDLTSLHIWELWEVRSSVTLYLTGDLTLCEARR